MRFYLNGRHQGLDYLVERPDEHYLEAHFGHPDFLIASTESRRADIRDPASSGIIRRGPAEPYVELVEWLKNQPSPTMEEIEERVDLEDLTRWVIATMICEVEEHSTSQIRTRDGSGQPGIWTCRSAFGVLSRPVVAPRSSRGPIRCFRASRSGIASGSKVVSDESYWRASFGTPLITGTILLGSSSRS